MNGRINKIVRNLKKNVFHTNNQMVMSRKTHVM